MKPLVFGQWRLWVERKKLADVYVFRQIHGADIVAAQDLMREPQTADGVSCVAVSA